MQRQCRSIDRRKASIILVTCAVDRNGSSTDVRLNRPLVDDRNIGRNSDSGNVAHIAILATDRNFRTDRQCRTRCGDRQRIVRGVLPKDYGSRPAQGLAADEIQPTEHVARQRTQCQRPIQCQAVLHCHIGVIRNGDVSVHRYAVQCAAAPRHLAPRRDVDRSANERVVERKRTCRIHRQRPDVRQRALN